jgi:hypothetical protein
MHQPIEMIPHLSAERWQKARQRAIDTVRASVPEPDPAHYISQRGISTFPAWFTRGLIALLVIVAGAAFWMSAGKQIMAAGMLITPLSASPRLSPFWGDTAIILSLAFGELGAILFQVAASVFDGRGRRLVFRTFAVLCAALAVIANVSITATHQVGEVAVFEWLLTLIPPVAVLGIGMLIEGLVMHSLKARAEQRAAYQAAMVAYRQAQADPEKHPDFGRTWAKAIFDELCRYKRDRDLIMPLVEQDRAVMLQLVQREYAEHMAWENFDPTAGKLETGKSGKLESGLSNGKLESGNYQLTNGNLDNGNYQVSSGNPESGGKLESRLSNGNGKPVSKLDRIVMHLMENPADQALSNRALAEKIGDVSHVLVGQAKQIVRDTLNHQE